MINENISPIFKAKILVAEDEGIIAMSLKRILVRNGYDVVALARTGEEVIRILPDINPDLILMDIMLEGSLNGIETSNHIRKYYSVPIIYITALNDDETFLEAYKSHPEEYIVKPFCEDKLLSSIEKALKKRHTEKFLK